MRRRVTAVTALCLLLACDSGTPASAPKTEPSAAKTEADAPADPPPSAGDSPRAEPSPEAPSQPVMEDAKLELGDMPKGRRYGVESGIIEYQVSGAREGTERLYFVDFGAREARYTQTHDSGPTPSGPPTDELVLIDGDAQHTIDMRSKTGTTMLNVMKDGGMGAPPGGSLVVLGKAMVERLGGTKTGTRTVAGVECEVFSVASMGAEACIKDGVPLAVTLARKDIKEVQTATKIEFGATVPADKLAVPADAKLKVLDLGTMFAPPPGATPPGGMPPSGLAPGEPPPG